jgi:hypothetical protein
MILRSGFKNVAKFDARVLGTNAGRDGQTNTARLPTLILVAAQPVACQPHPAI